MKEEVLQNLKEYEITPEITEQLAELSKFMLCPKEELVGQEIKGSEILKMGVSQIRKGGIITSVDPAETYKAKVVKVYPFDWYEEFSSVYKNHGILGLLSSVSAIVPQYIEQGRKIYPRLYNDKGQCEMFDPFIVLQTMEETWATKNAKKKK